MLAGFIQLIHILVCVGLIIIVLLQADKGGGLSGAFGGGASSTVFGERGDGGIMSKLTTTMAVVFMITSLVISVFVPRWVDKTPTINYSQNAAPTMPMAMPGMPAVEVPAVPALPAAAIPVEPVTPAPVAPIAPVAPVGEIPSGN
ncbi:MAG: preprotein translocase subunit SecG [Candidatus Riflebacteria bacterium]|nr:preprotein translocase subunit SecG [Candidatus Riflebacteria bacterium]